MTVMPMAMTDSHGNAQSESCHVSEMKKRRKKKNEEQLQVEVCPTPLVESVIPIVSQEENPETTADNPNPTPKKKKKKKKKKKLEDAAKLQTRDPSIVIGVEPDVRNGEGAQQGDDNRDGGLCPKPLLDTAFPVVPQEGNAETATHNPNSFPRKKKKKVHGAQHVQRCDHSIQIAVESDDVTKGEGALRGSEKAKTTAEDSNFTLKRKKKKKNVQGAQQQLQTPNPSTQIGVEPDVMKKEGAQQASEKEEITAENSNPALKRKKKKKKKTVLKPQGAELEPEPDTKESNNLENAQQCALDLKPKNKMKKRVEANAENSEMEKEAEPFENPEAVSQSCSTAIAEPLPVPTPIDQSRRKQKNKRGKEKIMCPEEKVENQGGALHIDITLNQAPHNVQQDQATPICQQPASLTGHTIPIDPAIPIDPEQTKKKKQRKNALELEEPNDNKHDTEQPEISIQTSKCLIEAPPIDPAIPADPSLAIPTCPSITTEPEKELSKKKKKRKSALKSEAAEPNELNSKLPEATLPEATLQKSIYPIAAPSIDPIISKGPAPPVETETPINESLEMTEKKRKRQRKKRSALMSEGTEPNEHDVKPPETTGQSFVYPILATSIDPVIPVPAPPIDQGQKLSKKRRKSALTSEGAEPSEHDGNSPGTPVQRSIYPIPEPSIDPTIPQGQASPVDPEETTKRKRKGKGNSALENEGLESEKHYDALMVQKIEGPSTENSTGGCNAMPSAKTTVQRTDSLRVTKSPFKHYGENSLSCRACGQPGHKFQHCHRLKCLSLDEEVCFFCGEIGHSLGKCGVSQPGGRCFAKCLLCYEHGHFSYNCPQNGHRIDPKVLAANRAHR